jgi:hypothetical protein
VTGTGGTLALLSLGLAGNIEFGWRKQ